MIYKTHKNIKKINKLIRDISNLFKKKVTIFPLGSLNRPEYKYITDVDIVMMLDIKKHNILDYFYKIINFIDSSDLIFDYLKLEELPDKYLKENNLIFRDGENQKKNEYRRWEKEEIDMGIKLDHAFNFMFLEETITYLFKSNEKIIINFFYKLNEQTYIPVSICIHSNIKKRDMYKIYLDYFAKKDYIHAFKSLNTFSIMIQNQFILNEIDSNNLLKLNNNYDSKIFNLNFLSSIKTQVELIGLIENYKVDINNIINNLLQIVSKSLHFGKIKINIYKLKKSKSNYFSKIQDINSILDKIYEIINNNFKKELEHESKIVEDIYKKISNKKIKEKKMTKKKIVVKLNNTKKA